MIRKGTDAVLRRNDAEKSMELLELIDQTPGHIITVPQTKRLVELFASYKPWEFVREDIRRFTPSIRRLNLEIACLIGDGKLEEAKERAANSTDVVEYETFALLSSADVDPAFQLKLIEDIGKKRSGKLSLKAYNEVIQNCLKAKDGPDANVARFVLSEITANGLKPNATIYAGVIATQIAVSLII